MTYEVKITVDGILNTINVPENNNNIIFEMATNMFGRSNIQIIDIQRKD